MVIAFASTPFSLSNFDANCWVRASGNFKSKRSKPKGIGLFFVKAYHHPTQKSRNQAAARCLRVQHVKNQVAARVTAHFFATHNCYCFIITSRKNEILDRPLMDDNSSHQSFKESNLLKVTAKTPVSPTPSRSHFNF